MKALVTGASSGIGRDFAKLLADMNYELFLVARNEEKLIELQKELNTKVTIFLYDLSEPQNCKDLYEQVKNENIDVLINNAGYGVFGLFKDADLEKELNMIDLNIKSVHILTKLFLNDFIKKDSGYILNVSSVSGLLAGGPFLSSYYASKAYVVRLTQAIYEELRRSKSNVSISTLCPGPVETNFNNRAGVKFNVKSLSSIYVAKYALKKMFRKKLVIIPGLSVRLGVFAKRFVSDKFLTKLTYNFQTKKK